MIYLRRTFSNNSENETTETGNTDEFTSLLFPFVKNEKNAESTPKTSPAHSAESIHNSIGNINPLEALRNSVLKTAAENRQEESETKAKTPATEAENKPADRAKRTSSLLAKCMPYISDDLGNTYADEKPDYTLESVEDIIESAEKRADEKIARMYNLKPTVIEAVDEPEEPAEPEQRPKLKFEKTSVKRPLKIGEVANPEQRVFDTVAIPKVSATLFDDFSARRTDISDGDNVITPYSAPVGTEDEEGHTCIVPDLKSQINAEKTYEDIASSSVPTEMEDISSSSKKRVHKVFTDDFEYPEEDDYRSAADISRVGGELKLKLFTSRLKLLVTLAATLVSIAVQLPMLVGSSDSGATAYLISFICFVITALVNINIFSSVAGIFKHKPQIELVPVLSCVFCTVYSIYGFIAEAYESVPAVLFSVSILAYDLFMYKKASAIFANFRLVASRRTKTAVTLIKNADVNKAMARSFSDGETLTAGECETDEIFDFLRHTRSDRPFGGKVTLYTVITLIFTAIFAPAIGVSSSSLQNGFLAASIITSLAAMPTLFIADMLPFVGLCGKLRPLRAAVCSKSSAEQIEQINHTVISSADLFPNGCIKLYNMSPLSSNNLDDTITMAAAVSKAANSPLYPMFGKILTDDTVLPEADTVKYEDNLGISGWVKDTHIMIGNRSHMLAHGITVPELEVDKKILQKGFFPVYIACNQRACALLTVQYSTNDDLANELSRLCDKGITLLVDNCDPNITEQMLCDYYAIYPENIKILDHNGSEKYHTETAAVKNCSAHAFHRGNLHSFLSVLSGCLRLRTLSNVLYIIHTIIAAISCLIFAIVSLGGALSVMSMSVCILCELAGIVIALTAYFAGK